MQRRRELNSEETNALGGRNAPLSPIAGFKRFDLSELKDDINNDENTLGRGGFCSVYKGILKDGNEVAIKRFRISDLSSWVCTYDLHVLVSKLQHKNILKVLGYGKTDKDKEKECFLVSEYMPNGSLEMIIRESSELNWSSLVWIIQGIAEGVHYLHEHCVIHLDLKPSNILLDSNMNAKIADFDISVIVDDNEVNMDFIAGTLGYVDPEYLAGFTVTKKNDVYAFGITLLETVCSIRRCKSTTTSSTHRLALDQWAWKAWEAGRIDEEFDPSLFDGSQLTEIKRCVVIGLLCAQDRREYRPSMADVLEILNGKDELPTPKKPAYILSDEERLSAKQLDGERPASPSAWSDGSLSPR